MNKTYDNPWPGNNNSNFTVGIYGPDHGLTDSLREFFHTHNCQVLVNPADDPPLDYVIAIGDELFVKGITAKAIIDTYRSLAIISGDEIIDLKQIHNIYQKTVLINFTKLAPAQIKKIFSFWITQQEKILDLRDRSKKPVVKLVTSPVKHIPQVNHNPDIKKENFRQFNSFEIDQKQEQLEQKINRTIKEIYKTNASKINKNKINRLSTRGRILLTIILIFSPVLWYGLMTVLSLTMLGLGINLINKVLIQPAQISSGLGCYFNRQSDFALSAIKYPFSYFNADKKFEILSDTNLFLNYICQIEKSTLELLPLGINFTRNSLPSLTGDSTDFNPLSTTMEFKKKLPYIYNKLGLAEAVLQKPLYSVKKLNIKFINNSLNRVSGKLKKTRSKVGLGMNLLTFYELLGGFKSDTRILVLLQNHLELRPTGGFIGSLGLLTLSQGQIKAFDVHDVYTYDGQLKGHVDPPEPIRDLLGTEHWYLRDSNWNPDFSISAKQAAWFFQKEGGDPVAAVIGINSQVVEGLLKITGPIDLPDYNDRITSENFFGKSLYYTQNKFFAGSTQKKDFLGSLMQTIFDQTANVSGQKFIDILQVISGEIDNGNIMFYFEDRSPEKLASAINISGTYPPDWTCSRGETDTNCLVNLIGIIEANLSVSKGNYFLYQDRLHELNISPDGLLTTTVNIHYKNTAEEVHGVAGNYRNYLRLYFPKEASLSAVILDNNPVSINTATSSANIKLPYYQMLDEENVNVAGVAFDIAAKKESRFSLVYSLNLNRLNTGSKMTLELLEPRQPGLTNVTSRVNINFPRNWRATAELIDSDQSLLVNPGQVEYNSKMTRDNHLRVVFN